MPILCSACLKPWTDPATWRESERCPFRLGGQERSAARGRAS